MEAVSCRIRSASRWMLWVAAIALLSPAFAKAQHYEALLEPSPYQALPIPGGGPVTIHGGSAIKGWSYTPNSHTFQLPFHVGFYGQTYDKFVMLGEGIITFDLQATGGSTRRMRAIPGSAAPHNFIAVWWDQVVCNDVLTTGKEDNVKTQVVGTAPNRKFVLEWERCRRFSGSPAGEITAQVWLSEGSDEIEVHYGPIVASDWQAVMGVENHDGSQGTAGLSLSGTVCNPNCGSQDFPTNMKVRYSSGPNITVGDVSGAVEGFAGIRFPIDFSLSNTGSKPAENFTVRYWVNSEPSLAGATSMGYDSRHWSLLPKERVGVSAETVLPIELEEGTYYVLVEADPHHAVALSNRGSTVGVFGPFRIGIRAANLKVGWIDVPEKMTPGETVEVRWEASNEGNLGTVRVPYRVVLSDTPFVSPNSLTIGEGMLGEMPMGASGWESVLVGVPDDVEAGVYYVGVEIDPNRDIFEHERRDNVGVSSPVVVATDELVVVTKELPDGQVSGHYSVRLVAFGGDGHHLWRPAEGSTMPPGLALVPRIDRLGGSSTFLEGIPASTGSFTLRLEVSSAGDVVEVVYSLEIGHGSHGLSVVTEHLARGAFGFRYEDHLGAIGGVPPYTWDVQGTLPHGLFLRSDGLLSGTPEQDGIFRIKFGVEDSTQQRGSKELEIEIAAPHHLTCVTKELPPLRIGETVRFELVAAGGTKNSSGGYTWLPGDSVQMATELGVAPKAPRAGPPEGLGLDQNVVRGAPKKFGSFLWNVQVRDLASSEPLRCPIRVDVPRDHGLTVATRALPVAVAGQSYRAHLSASGGQGTLEWSEFAGGRVLSDLGLSFDGAAIIGTPSIDALQGEPEKSFTFMVLAEDEMGRVGYGALTLRIAAQPHRSKVGKEKESESGCQVGRSAPVPWLLALMGLVLLRRRR